jgi:uncharacterized protein YbaA (DUF1428 family)
MPGGAPSIRLKRPRRSTHRHAVNQKVMADPRLKGDMPFDGKRLVHGGFEMWLET